MSVPLLSDHEGLLKDLYGSCKIDVCVGDSEPPCRTPEDWLRVKCFERLSILCSCEVSRRRVDCYEVVLWDVEKRGDLILSFGGVDVKYRKRRLKRDPRRAEGSGDVVSHDVSSTSPRSFGRRS